jgi:hypothetical protein
MLSTAPRSIHEPARASAFILWFDEVSINDLPLVGGKNASEAIVKTESLEIIITLNIDIRK